MTINTKTVGVILVGVGAAAYVGYLHRKVRKLSYAAKAKIDELAAKVNVDIQDELLERAIRQAVHDTTSRIVSQMSRELELEIRSKVRQHIDILTDDTKAAVSLEITNRLSKIDISGMQKEVVEKAKDAIAVKFDSRLDDLLEEFNGNLQNVQKIYSSIAKSMSKGLNN